MCSQPAVGVNGVLTNTRNTPIEALERAFPLRASQPRGLAGGEPGALSGDGDRRPCGAGRLRSARSRMGILFSPLG